MSAVKVGDRFRRIYTAHPGGESLLIVETILGRGKLVCRTLSGKRASVDEKNLTDPRKYRREDR